MADHVTGTDPTWRDALARAGRRLPATDPGAHLFVEQRDDTRVALDTEGRSETVLTRLEGMAASGIGRNLFLSAMDPDRIEPLARALSGEPLQNRPVSPSHAVVPPEPPPAFRLADRLLDAALSLRGSGLLQAHIAAVEFRQHVWGGDHRGRVWQDARRGLRVRIKVRSTSGGRAVSEAVIRDGRRLDAEKTVQRVLARARRVVVRREAPAGETAVVFAPGTGGVLVHELVGHALEADTILRGGSALGEARGMVAHPDVLVVDDPRRGRAPWRVDDEGTEPRPTALLRDGMVVGRLHDLRTARRSSQAPTGHGRRASFREPVLPRMGCTFLAAGCRTPEEVIRCTTKGVYVRRMESAGTDPSAGIAVFRVTDADRIADGRIQEPLAPFLLRVSARVALSTLDHVADDLVFDSCVGSCSREGQAIPASVGAPTFRIRVAKVIR